MARKPRLGIVQGTPQWPLSSSFSFRVRHLSLHTIPRTRTLTLLHAHALGRAQIGVIQSNPEKSKHLETATVQLGKFSVDFVNLRTETYADDSRIPEVRTPTYAPIYACN